MRSLVLTTLLAHLLAGGGIVASAGDAHARGASLLRRARAAVRPLVRGLHHVRVSLALRRAGLVSVRGSKRFTRASYSGGALTPGARSEAFRMIREVRALQRKATRVRSRRGTLRFFAGDTLIGTLTVTPKQRAREHGAIVKRQRAVLQLPSGERKTFALRVAKNREHRGGSLKNSRYVSVQVHKPGAPVRRLEEIWVRSGGTRGEHLVGLPTPATHVQPGGLRFQTVEGYKAQGLNRRRQIETGPAARYHISTARNPFGLTIK